MILTVVSFFAGVTSLYFFRDLPSLSIVSLVVAVFALITLVPQARKCKCHILLVFSIGLLWALFNTYAIYEQRLPFDLQKKPLEIVGVVSSIPEFQNGIQCFEMDIKSIFPKTLWANPGRIKLRWYDGPESLRVGEVWRLTVKLKRPHAYANPGSFDSERHAFQNRIVAEGTVVDKFPARKIKNFNPRYGLDRIRSWFRDRIQYQLDKRPFAGIVTALVIGINKGITIEQWEIFRNTGTAHLVAISGLHIGLAASFAFLIVRLIGRRLPQSVLRFPIPWIAAIAGGSTAIIYALLAGFSVPTQRAVVMIFCFMTGIISRRLMSVWRSYWLALAVVVLLDPLSPLMPGFWLSFAAVGIILYGMQGRLKPTSLWWRFGRAQWVVFLGLSPLTLAIFNMTSWVSPFANMLAIPWVSFVVVPLGLMGALLGLINERLGYYGFSLAEHAMALLWLLLKKVSLFPKATWVTAVQTPFTLALSLIAIMVWLAPRGFPGKWLSIIFLLPLLLIEAPLIEKNTVRFTVLDVGQGLSAVIETANHVLVFDTGPKLGQVDTGQLVVLPFLATRGQTKIDALVISHGDNDHAGGAGSILQAMPVKNVITSEPNLFSKQNVSLCFAGKQWEWDGVQFLMLHPESLTTRKRNDHSCVLQVKVGQQSVLLTGDIEAISEKQILKKTKNILASTVMMVPHHGSRTSSTLEFIQAINPRYAIIPVGYQNTYGHPKPDIVERYQKEGITVLNTVRDGAITFLLKDAVDVETPHLYRIDNKRIWHLQGVNEEIR